MVKSMTGYGRGVSEDSSRSVELEFKSVNNRYFDVNIRMPKSLIVLEDRIRKKLNSKVSRGKVDLFINYKNLEKSNLDITINRELAKKYITNLRELSNELSINDDLSVSLLTKLDDIISVEEKQDNVEIAWNVIESALDKAILNHDEMRSIEGNKLKEDILEKKNVIMDKLSIIEQIIPNLVPIFREKLTERLKELDQKFVDDDKIAYEVALYADKSSIDEEVTRLKSHMNQLGQILELNEPIGRKLDFLVQEMNREANTMASKSVDLELTSNVLLIKNEIEKIREQVQNIE